MKISNSKGKVFYGLHFYPGLAQYQEDGKDPYKVFLNEDTLRKMDPTFAGRPIFVEHVDEVDPDLNQLRKEAEGWVVESFFNSADGMHWVKFIVVTDAAERAIRNGHRLSNAYIPKSFKEGGMWNGIPYQKEITDGEYEHLALVKHPRYEESVILSPDEFKQYNENKVLELKKLSNSTEKRPKMGFSFFKKTKVEDAFDPELQVILPKSGKTMSLTKLINEADDKMNKEEDKEMPMKDSEDKSEGMAHPDHMVKMHDGSYMKVKDMANKMKAMNDEMEEMKKPKKDAKELDLAVKEEEVKSEGDSKNDADESMKDDLEKNPEEAVHDESDDEEAKKKALQLAEHEEKEIVEAKAAKKKNDAKEKADKLKNAHMKAFQNTMEEQVIELSSDMAARGKQRYGS